MDWTIIEKISHHPAFLAVTSVFSIILGVCVIISKTEWGKKAIRSLTNRANKVEEKVNNNRSYIAEKVEEINEVKQGVLDLKEEVKNEVKVYFNQLEFFEKGVYNIISQIPNAKVQEQLKVFYGGWQDKKKEIQSFVGESFTEINEKVKELEESKNRELDSLRHEIEQLKELVTNSTKVVENVENEERKESFNEETNQE